MCIPKRTDRKSGERQSPWERPRGAGSKNLSRRLAEESTVHAQLAAAIAARESARTQKQDAKQLEREAGALRKRTTEAVEEQSR